MQITRNGVKTGEGPVAWFTGAVHIDPVAVPMAASTTPRRPATDEPSGTAPESAATRLGRVAIIGGLSMFGPLSIDMYLPGPPGLAHDLNGDTAGAQVTLATCLLGLAAGQLLAGPLSDQLGRRRPLMVGLLAYVVASLLCALAPSLPVLTLLRLLQGAAGFAAARGV